MTEELIKHLMNDEEVRMSGVDSYQIAVVIACALQFLRNQPERSKREDSFPSDHIWCGCPECGECGCKRCGALNIVETL